MKKKKQFFEEETKEEEKNDGKKKRDEEFKRQGTILYLFLKMENKVAIMVDHGWGKRDIPMKWNGHQRRGEALRIRRALTGYDYY